MPRARRPAERPAAARGPTRLARATPPLLVLVATFLAFLPALDAGFVNYDDDRLFLNNTSYRGFGTAHLKWMFTTTFMGHYQPLVWLSSALDYTISGTEPLSYHLNNLILHAVNALILYFVAMRLLAAAAKLQPGSHPLALRGAAAVAALLFAVHPLRVESVAWASERRDVLSTIFLLLALAAYLRAFRREEREVGSWGWYAASCGFLTLSLLSKAWAMSFVVVVAVLDVYPLRRLPGRAHQWWQRDCRRVWIQKAPYLLLGVGAAVVAGHAQRTALHTMMNLAEWGIPERLVQAAYGLTFYPAKTIWPTQLAAIVELPYRLNPLELRYVLSYLAVIGGAVAVILLRRRLPSLAAATVLYVVIVAPVLGFAQSGPQLVADKYSYVCCIGWALLAGGGLLTLWSRRGFDARGVAGGLAAAFVLIILFVLTVRQTNVWHDSKTLWTHALAVGRPTCIANLNYGIQIRKEGRINEAIDHYRAAVELRPDYGLAHFALANALKAQKRWFEAEAAYHEAARFMVEKNSAYLNLGNMYYRNLKRRGDAIEAYRAAIDYIEALPSKVFSPMPYLGLGIALKDKGDVEGARKALEVAKRYNKTRKRAMKELATLAVESKK